VKLTQIDLNLFVVFDTVYAERNLTRAADRLAITQPAVSNALARLRRNFNDPLFVRTSTGMQPTAFAESIAHRVGDALQALHIAAQPPDLFDPAESDRRFLISMLDFYGATALPKICRTLQQQAPHTSLQSLRLARADLPHALERGHVDIATDIPLQDASDLVSHTLVQDRYVCAVRKGHPLEHEELTLEQYLRMDHLHVSGRRQGEGAVDIALRRKGLKRNIVVHLQSHLAVSEIIQATDLAVTLTEGWAASLPLSIRPLPIKVASAEIRLYRHVRSNGDAAVVWLFDLIKALPISMNAVG
jgi:DNA-binding transcriptional LysR family regulator